MRQRLGSFVLVIGILQACAPAEQPSSSGALESKADRPGRGSPADAGIRDVTASEVRIEITAVAGGELAVLEEASGWVLKRGDYTLETSADVTSLPWEQSFDDFHVSIGLDGKVRLLFSVGDSDASGAASSNLPMLDGTPMATSTPFEVVLRAGDHASGSWQINATARIEIGGSP